MSKISNLESGTNIKDSFIFLAVSNSKNLKVPSYKLINFLNKNLEISKTRPFLSSSDFPNNKFVLTSKTNKLYVTKISPSEISYDLNTKLEFEQACKDLNVILNGDYATARDKILTYINSKESIINDVNKTVPERTFEESALSDIYSISVPSGTDSNVDGSDFIAVFTNNKLTKLHLDKTVYKGYYILKNIPSILSSIEKIGNISSKINEDMIKIQKAGTEKIYIDSGELYSWNFGTEDARKLPYEHIRHIIDTIKLNSPETNLSDASNKLNILIGSQNKNEDEEDSSPDDKDIKLEDIVSDIRYKIATTNNKFIEKNEINEYKFYKIYDLYSAGQELYDIMDTILEYVEDPNRPKWEGEYTQYLDYTKCGSSETWGKVENTDDLLDESKNYVNYTKIFG